MRLSGDKAEFIRKTIRPCLIVAILIWITIAGMAGYRYGYQPLNKTARLLAQRVIFCTQPPPRVMDEPVVSSEFPKIEILSAGIKHCWWLLLRRRLHWQRPSFYLRYPPQARANGGHRDLAGGKSA
ncbi:hypothetical protein ACFLXQ_03295 [Chloroflexota bacterium]